MKGPIVKLALVGAVTVLLLAGLAATSGDRLEIDYDHGKAHLVLAPAASPPRH